LEPHHRVLEIGTGSGYQTAILAALAAEVWTIERIETLSLQARNTLSSLGIKNVHYRVGDGSLGWPEAAPFDAVIVTAGAPDVPDALRDQLVEGGRLVIPVGDEREQDLVVVRRDSGRTLREHCFPCRFVKLIGQQAWPK
jgi:protein-L-isoaspartate(D-aspartate) O-methyltransferase